MTLSDILDWRKAPKLIEYLSLDVEGHEWEVIGAFPFDRYAFKVITIERPSDGMRRSSHSTIIRTRGTWTGTMAMTSTRCGCIRRWRRG